MREREREREEREREREDMGTSGSKELGSISSPSGGGGGGGGGGFLARDEGFITVGTAKSPQEERQESTEGAILRKVGEIEVTRPVLSCKRKDLEELSQGGRVQWALEAAFSALAKWYAKQATLVTRQQLGLHEEIEEVSYMVKLAVQSVNRNRDALKQSSKDAQGLNLLSQDIAALRKAVENAVETHEKLSQTLNLSESADSETSSPKKM